MSNIVKIGDITASCLGKMLDAKKNKGEYHPYLANINVRWGSFDLDDLPLMRFENSEHERYGLKKGDLVMCEGGEPGRCAIWKEEVPNMKIQKALHRIRAKEDLLDIRYLYYWFLLAGQQNLLKGYFTETTIKHLPGDKLKEIELNLPSLEQQQKIADVLTPIDDRISNNQKIIQTLTRYAKTIYDYWFVQFEFPNADGKPYKSSGGEMVWCEELKTAIPKGWSVFPLSSFMTIKTSTVNPKNHSNEIFEHYSIPAFDDNNYPVFETGASIESGKYRVVPEAILVSKLNPQFKRVWNPLCETENAICSTEFMVYVPNEIWMRPYCFGVLNCDAFHSHMKAKAISSTGSRKRIQPDVSASFECALPAKEIIEGFCEIYSPIMEKQKKLCKENQQLIELRDWLLPLLMNGQATIE